MIGQRVMPAKVGIIAAEPIAPVVAHSPLLRASGRRFDNAFVRLNAKIPIAELNRLTGNRTLNLAAKQSTRSVHPTVQSIFQTVDTGLKIPDTEAGEQFAHHIRFAVALAVLRINDVGG